LTEEREREKKEKRERMDAFQRLPHRERYGGVQYVPPYISAAIT
jgi:hypothetical protein